MINGGFFVLSPKVIDPIEDDQTVWERSFRNTCKIKQFESFSARRFLAPMDTLRDKNHLEELWKSGKAPGKRGYETIILV